jgi:hypothetical protein
VELAKSGLSSAHTQGQEIFMTKRKPVICIQVIIDVMGPADTSRKRIRFVADILRNCIRTLDKDFRKSRIPQMKGFSLKLPRQGHKAKP